MTATAQRSRREFAGPAEQRSFRRRLAILSLLHIRPRSRRELIASLDEQGLLANDILVDPLTDPHIANQFQNDLKALNACNCIVRADRHTNIYHWHNSPFDLSLDAAQLNGLVILLTSFGQPPHPDLAALLDYLRTSLPAEQQRQLPTPTFSIQVQHSSEYREADPHNKQQIEMAIRRRQQLELDYISPKEGRLVHHIVEPQPFRMEGDHVYLPIWDVKINKEYKLKLTRIQPGTAKMLRTPMQHQRIDRTSYRLRYRLSPSISRDGVTTHFADQQVEYDPADGWAIIVATIAEKEYFDARRLLLSYGSNVIVESPPELVAEIADEIAVLHQRYLTKEL